LIWRSANPSRTPARIFETAWAAGIVQTDKRGCAEREAMLTGARKNGCATAVAVAAEGAAFR
jgi:hypothetical protein